MLQAGKKLWADLNLLHAADTRLSARSAFCCQQKGSFGLEAVTALHKHRRSCCCHPLQQQGGGHNQQHMFPIQHVSHRDGPKVAAGDSQSTVTALSWNSEGSCLAAGTSSGEAVIWQYSASPTSSDLAVEPALCWQLCQGVTVPARVEAAAWGGHRGSVRLCDSSSLTDERAAWGRHKGVGSFVALIDGVSISGSFHIFVALLPPKPQSCARLLSSSCMTVLCRPSRQASWAQPSTCPATQGLHAPCIFSAVVADRIELLMHFIRQVTQPNNPCRFLALASPGGLHVCAETALQRRMKGAAAAVQLDAHQLVFEPQGGSVSLRVTSQLQISGGRLMCRQSADVMGLELQVSGGLGGNAWLTPCHDGLHLPLVPQGSSCCGQCPASCSTFSAT